MLKVEFTGVQGVSRALAAVVRSEIQLLSNEVYSEVRKRTPVDTGRAKRGWKQQTQTNSFSVENAVPYVPVLDKGRHMTNRGIRGSKQAPKGIVGPALNSIKGRN